MSKTPEEMAYEYGEKFDGVEISKNDINIAWYEGYEAAQEHAHAALEEAEARIQELQDQLADADKVMPQWISVKDRLPKIGAVVLVAKDIGSVNTTYFGVNGFRGEPVTHWMPLPESPKEEG
jgi:hypothetical protein